MGNKCRCDLGHSLVLPTLLFTVLGGMTWAVRGCSGYGAAMGCVFAGVTWGAAWWYISREPGTEQARRYNSGWIILAMTFGFGFSGARGWMQWPSFFEGHLLLNAGKNEFVPISRVYGFVWLFIAGMPWAGIGACMLAWCGSERKLNVTDWVIRIACGVGGAVAASIIYRLLPQVFLPYYHSMYAQYHDFAANPNLKRLIGDNGSAIRHLGLYLGFLGYEIGRRDRKNVTLILTVGVVAGLGWSLCQNWRWAGPIWGNGVFNFWRCWESSGGLSIGIAYGIAYFLVNRPVADSERERVGWLLKNGNPNLELFGLYFGLIFGLGLSIKCGLKGWANIYIGNEDYWSMVLTSIFLPLMLVSLAGVIVWTRRKPLPKGYPGDLFPHAYAIVWTVILCQNVLAQLVTGPRTVWSEMAFKIYYVLLFCISAVILYHYHFAKEKTCKS